MYSVHALFFFLFFFCALANGVFRLIYLILVESRSYVLELRKDKGNRPPATT